MPTQTNPPPTQNDSLATATSESQEALASMEADAAEFFANRDAGRTSSALNPVAPALEKATSGEKGAKAAKSAPAAEKSAEKVAPASGKVAGAPTLKAKSTDKAVEGAKTATTEGAEGTGAAKTEDFSEIPRQYVAGSVRAVNWDKLHKKADHFESLSAAAAAERDALRAELEQVRAAGASGAPSADVTARLAALQAERDALHSQLKAVAGERIFDAESKPRRDAAMMAAKLAAGSEAARVEAILSLPDGTHREDQIQELVNNLTPLRATKLTNAIAELDRLSLERGAAASAGGEMWQRRVSEANAAREREAAESAARANATFDAELKEWEPVGLAAEEVANARAVYSGQGATLQDAARASMWAVAGPKIAAQAQALQGRVEELEGELAKLRSAQPGVRGDGGGAAATEGEDDPDTTSYAERIAKQALRAGVRFGAGA